MSTKTSHLKKTLILATFALVAAPAVGQASGCLASTDPAGDVAVHDIAIAGRYDTAMDLLGGGVGIENGDLVVRWDLAAAPAPASGLLGTGDTRGYNFQVFGLDPGDWEGGIFVSLHPDGSLTATGSGNTYGGASSAFGVTATVEGDSIVARAALGDTGASGGDRLFDIMMETDRHVIPFAGNADAIDEGLLDGGWTGTLSHC